MKGHLTQTVTIESIPTTDRSKRKSLLEYMH